MRLLISIGVLIDKFLLMCAARYCIVKPDTDYHHSLCLNIRLSRDLLSEIVFPRCNLRSLAVGGSKEAGKTRSKPRRRRRSRRSDGVVVFLCDYPSQN